jgi:hypothetical protein
MRTAVRSSPLQKLADTLRAKPGEWANLGERSSSVAYNIRKGQGAFAPEGSFEATTRATKGNRALVYVRYIGAPEEAPEQPRADA